MLHFFFLYFFFFQAEDGIRDEPMRADDNIDAAFAQQPQHFFLLRLRTETAEHFYADWVIEHALPEHLEMLLSKNRGWGQHGHLFAVHDGFKRGADRHFGFAKDRKSVV